MTDNTLPDGRAVTDNTPPTDPAIAGAIAPADVQPDTPKQPTHVIVAIDTVQRIRQALDCLKVDFHEIAGWTAEAIHEIAADLEGSLPPWLR